MANHDPSGKVCLVTGAGTGLARAMTLALVGKGAHVLACDLNEKGLDETAAMAKAQGASGRLQPHVIDVSDDAQCIAAVARADKEFGRLDVLVNCAGLGPVYMRHNFVADPLRFWDADKTRWWRMFEVNVRGPFQLMRAAAPGMIARKWGRVVNITTSFSTMIRGGNMPYGMTKSALEAGSASWSVDLQGTGVTCNVLIPGGAADTTMIPQEVMPDRNKLVPASAMQAPIAFLASPASDGVTGKRFVAQFFDAENPLSAPGCAAVAWPALAAASSQGIGEDDANRKATKT